MPGFVLHLGASVQCAHGAPAVPMTPFPRVLVSGQPVATIASNYVITGCPQVPPPIPTCVTGRWLTSSVRVTAGGNPILLFDSLGVAEQNMLPLRPVSSQMKAQAI